MQVLTLLRDMAYIPVHVQGRKRTNFLRGQSHFS